MMVTHNHDSGEGRIESSSSRLERGEWMKIGAFGIAFIGAFVAVLSAFYMPRSEAEAVHSNQEQATALIKQEATLRLEFDKQKDHNAEAAMKDLATALRETKAIQKVQDDNVRRLLRDMNVTPKRMPANITFDDIE